MGELVRCRISSALGLGAWSGWGGLHREPPHLCLLPEEEKIDRLEAWIGRPLYGSLWLIACLKRAGHRFQWHAGGALEILIIRVVETQSISLPRLEFDR